MRGRGDAAAAAVLGSILFVATCAVPHGPADRPLDTSLFALWGNRVLDGQIPYRDFSLEYPPGALPAFVVPAIGSGDYGSNFKLLEIAFGVAMVVSVAFALAALGATRRRLGVGVAFAALAPLALGPIVLIRFDLWPVALAAAGLAAVLAGRDRLGFGALAVATAAKIFPFVLVPLALLHVARRAGREAVRRSAIAFGVVVAAVVLPFAILGPGGLRFSVEQQSGRALQIETLGSAVLLAVHELAGYAVHPRFGSGSWNLVGAVPDGVAVAQTLLQIAVVGAVWIVYARSERTPQQLAAAAAAAVAAFAVFGRVLSPQYLLWLVPLVALLVGARALAAGALLVAAMILTRLVYPARYDALVDLESTPIWLLVARDALLVALAALLVAQVGIASRKK